jgi:hypothetical protein
MTAMVRTAVVPEAAVVGALPPNCDFHRPFCYVRLTSIPAVRSAQIAVTTDRRMACGTPVGRERSAPIVRRAFPIARRAAAPTSALSRHARKGCCDGQPRLDVAESMHGGRRLDMTSDHLQARALDRFETQRNHCVR